MQPNEHNYCPVPDLNTGECKANICTTVRDSDLRISSVERGDIATCFYIILYKVESFTHTIRVPIFSKDA